jgi:hypothetical protein
MRFAAGLTASGIIGLILLELFKLVAPVLKGWVVGILAVVLKVAAVVFALLAVALVVGIAVFFYQRGKRAGAGAD